MQKRTLFISTVLVAALGTAAVVYAQGPRHFRHGGDGHHGGPEFGMGGPDLGSGFRGRFGRPLTKDDHDTRTRERFAHLDKNSDGFVDAAEFEAVFGEQRRGMRGKLAEHGARFSERSIRFFDTNKDGKVSKDEHTAGIRKLFAEMDLNSDGRISDEDLPPMMRGRNILAQSGQRPGPAVRVGGGMGMPGLQVLRGADTNNDGVISLDEALAAGDKRFVEKDRNKDGNLDKADFDALRKEMTDYRVKRALHHFGGTKEGRVSREQFTAKALERFSMMDLNGDGSISREEMPMGGMRHRGGMHGFGSHSGEGEQPSHRGPGGMGPQSAPPAPR